MDQSKSITMKDYEKQIAKAAYKYSHSRLNNAYYNFLEGAKSPEAKEFHQQGMYSEEEVRVLLKQYFWWQWGNEISDDNFEEWFDQNKKKSEEPKEELVKVYDNLSGHPGGHWEPAPQSNACPIGSYESENKIAECKGNDTCLDLCIKCANFKFK